MFVNKMTGGVAQNANSGAPHCEVYPVESWCVRVCGVISYINYSNVLSL